MTTRFMDKDWVKLSEDGIECEVPCFYLCVGKQSIKSGTPNQAVLSSPSQQHISGVDISGVHQFNAKTFHQHICWAFGLKSILRLPLISSRSELCTKELHPDHFVMPNNKKMDALFISCQPGGDPNHMAYLPRKEVNYGIRGTSHAPVEAIPPEPAHTIFFWLNTKRSEVGSRGKHKQIMWSYYTCCVGYKLPKPWSVVATLERDKNRKLSARRGLRIWELCQRWAF